MHRNTWIALFALTACSELPSSAPPLIPPDRASEYSGGGQVTNDFRQLESDSLWRLIAAGDSTAIVGLKAPGESEGVRRGTVLVSETQLASAVHSLRSVPDLEIVRQNPRLPNLVARLTSAEAVRQLRLMPVVEYIEPAVIRGAFGYQTIGCTNPLEPGRALSPIGSDVLDVVPLTYKLNGVTKAWNLVSGAGVSIGLVDTGIYSSSDQLTSDMTSGYSAGRSVYTSHTYNYSTGYIPDSGCSHGPRMAGAIAAPRDDEGPIGVAWGSDFMSVRHNDDVAVFDISQAVDAISIASVFNEIVVMAFGSQDYWFNSLEDEILYFHYNADVLFVGAAGTYIGCLPMAMRNNTFFPAEIPEVIAVTGVDDAGNLACDVSHGPGTDVAAHINQPTTGRGTEIVSLAGSSNATAVVAGIAALIWERYPGMSRDQVRDRIEWSANGVRNSDTGYGVVDAYKGVGGFFHLEIAGPTCVSGFEWEISLTANAYGDGPFTYYWDNGSTSRTITVPAPQRGDPPVDFEVAVTDSLEGKLMYANHRVEALAPDDPRFICEEA